MNWVQFNLIILSATSVLLALWYRFGLLNRRWQIQIIFLKKYHFLSLNSANSVKTFRKNLIRLCV